MQKSSVRIISLRMRGHAQASGYDRLAYYLGYPVIEPVAVWTFRQRTVARTLRFLIQRSGSTWYHRDSLIGELHAAWEGLRYGAKLFHFLYGENSHRYLGTLKYLSRKTRIVCSYHTPPDKFCSLMRDRDHLRRLDAIITDQGYVAL